MDVEEYVDAFRALFEERFGGEDVAALTRGMSTEELEAMPPFPFPKFLFPKGTFPDGLRFDESSFTAPPKVKAFVDEHGEDALAALASELAAKAAKNRGAGGETLTRGGLSEEEELRAFIMDAMKDELDGLQFPEGEDMDEAMARLMESYCSKHHFRPEKVKLKYQDKKTGSAKAVEADQTPSDLGMSLEQEELVAVITVHICIFCRALGCCI